MPANPADDDPLYREAARRGERRIGDDAELYRRNRGIGGAAANDAPPAQTFRPRLGSTVTLFGREVALGFEHLSVLLVAGVLGGVEVAIGIVVLYLGVLFLRATPPVVPSADGAGGAAPRRRAPRPREPGIIGALKHFFGPLPEGSAVSAVQEDEAALAAASPSPSGGQVYSAPARTAGAAPAPAPAPARSPGIAVGGAPTRGDARAAAAAAAAARAAAAAAAQAE